MSTIVVPPFDEEHYPTLGPQIADWIEEYMVYGPGELKGDPYVITPEFRALLYRMYEVYPQDHKLAGRRRFKRCVLSLRKGTAKTEKGAILSIAEAHPYAPVRADGFDANGEPVGVGVKSPYIPMVAFSLTQTEDLAYAVARAIVEESPVVEDFDVGMERIMVLDSAGREAGKIVPLGGSPNARDGARTTFQFVDEALALDTKLPTPGGWTTVADVAAGDMLIGSDGLPVEVLGTTDIAEDRPCYRVTFKDGTSVVCDAGHLWSVRDGRGHRGYAQRWVWHTKTTQELVTGGVNGGYDGAYRWGVPTRPGWKLPEVDLPIDPYLLGVWLGDGDSTNATISGDRDDLHEITEHIRAAGYTTKFLKVRPDRVSLVYVGLPGGVRGRRHSFKTQLSDTGLIGNKHIPDEYMRASFDQRLSLLQGLMDSDGSVNKGGHATFSQRRRGLVEQTTELARSLGFNPTVHRTTDRRSTTGEHFKVTFHGDPARPPVRLRRKVERLRPPVHRARNEELKIVAIEEVASVPVRCVKVAANDSLFLAGEGMVLTHNTHLLHLPRLKRSHNVMQQNLFKRVGADAWMLETTTAFDPGQQSIAEEAMDYAKAIEAGKVDDPRMFYFHRQANEPLQLDKAEGVHQALVEATGAETWSGDIDALVSHYFEPNTDHQYFQRVWLNTPVAGAGRAFDVEAWKAGTQEHKIPEGELVVLGFDGARRRDSTALVATEVETGHQHIVGVWTRPDYADDDWEVPADDVDAMVDMAFAEWDVWRLYGDPPYWDDRLDAWAGKYGDDRVVKWWTNRPKPTSYSVRNYAEAIVNGEVTHDDSELFESHIGNAYRQEITLRDDEDQPLWLIRKERKDSPNKIDIAMAAILSWEARGDCIMKGSPRRRKRSRKLVSF